MGCRVPSSSSSSLHPPLLLHLVFFFSGPSRGPDLERSIQLRPQYWRESHSAKMRRFTRVAETQLSLSLSSSPLPFANIKASSVSHSGAIRIVSLVEWILTMPLIDTVVWFQLFLASFLLYTCFLLHLTRYQLHQLCAHTQAALTHDDPLVASSSCSFSPPLQRYVCSLLCIKVTITFGTLSPSSYLLKQEQHQVRSSLASQYSGLLYHTRVHRAIFIRMQ